MKNTTKISYYNNDSITQSLRIVKEITEGKLDIKHAPWLKNMYFVGRTLFLDVNTPTGEDSKTFCLSDESVGFFSGGMRKLISLEAVQIMKDLMDMSGVKRN